MRKTIALNVETQYIVITSHVEGNKKLSMLAKLRSLPVYSLPCISIRQQNITLQVKEILQSFDKIDALIFTSQQSVHAFIRLAKKLYIDNKYFNQKPMYAVGSETAAVLSNYNIKVTQFAEIYTSMDLVQMMRLKRHKLILFPHSSIVEKDTITSLVQTGIKVIPLEVYKTILITKKSHDFHLLVAKNKIYCIVFTSPSAVHGFFNRILDDSLSAQIRTIQVYCIGPKTAKVALDYDCNHVSTSSKHTYEGIFEKIAKDRLYSI